MGIGRDILHGLNVFSSDSPKKRASDSFKEANPGSPISLEKFQELLGLHEQIKRLKKDEEKTERRLKDFAGAYIPKSQRTEKIDKIIEIRLLPRYRALRNLWGRTPKPTQEQLIEMVGGQRPPWKVRSDENYL